MSASYVDGIAESSNNHETVPAKKKNVPLQHTAIAYFFTETKP
uniref:Uncharacterized protein n=1 Tax=Rhizophora mucronata TaxID=61149 RepID=A0A2P2QJC5_RHIMU